jgi:hypothetical protein
MRGTGILPVRDTGILPVNNGLEGRATWPLHPFMVSGWRLDTMFAVDGHGPPMAANLDLAGALDG